MAGAPPPPSPCLPARAQQEIVDAANTPVFLKGVSLGNEVWANKATPTDHAEIDFQRLADMGANSTRFLLNYVTFEDDAAPGVYKDAGWAWIDQNVAWAKAHGIRLVLNMHVPQGGFQSNGDGGALWSDVANQDRLTALWKEIARRYADEPIIAGFGLVNEPEPLASRQQWHDLASRLLTAIRSVDTNHIVFVERPIAIAGDFNSDADMNLFTLDDANIVYEFHFYDPTDYTFQLQPWNNTPDGGAYPDPTKIAGVTEQWINLATFDAPTAPVGTSDWTHYDGTRITAVELRDRRRASHARRAGARRGDDRVRRPDDQRVRRGRDVHPRGRAHPADHGQRLVLLVGQQRRHGEHRLGLQDERDLPDDHGHHRRRELRRLRLLLRAHAGVSVQHLGLDEGDQPAGGRGRAHPARPGRQLDAGARARQGRAPRHDGAVPRLGRGPRRAALPGRVRRLQGVLREQQGRSRLGRRRLRSRDRRRRAGGPRVAGLSYHQYHEDAFALYYGTGPVDPNNANQPLIDLLTAKLHAAP